MRRVLLLAALVGLAGCGSRSGSEKPAASAAPVAPQLSSAQVQPPPPGASGALVALVDSPQSRTRLAYVDDARLDGADLPFGADRVRRLVLADGFQSADESGSVSIGRDDTEPAAADDADVNALAGHSISAVQACLGDPFAETILGPGSLGEGVAAGAGLAISPEDPARIELRLCSVPPVRRLHALERRLEKRFGPLGGLVEEREIRELDLLTAVVPVDALKPGRALELLGDPSTL